MTDSALTNTGTGAKTLAKSATDTVGHPPAAPPTTTRAQDLLLDYLGDHDAACPVCGYNVRALTRPVCPECKQELTLAVGAPNLRMAWYLAALAPCFFSTIAATFVLALIIAHLIAIGSTWAVIVMFDSFGWCSAAFAIFLARRRGRVWFLGLPPARQRWLAILIWLVHIAALGTIISIGVVFF